MFIYLDSAINVFTYKFTSGRYCKEFIDMRRDKAGKSMDKENSQ